MGDDPKAESNPAPHMHTGSSIYLGSLLLVIALIAVIFGVLRENLVIGIALGFVGIVTLVRTAGIVRGHEDVGQSMSFEEKVVTFLGTGIVVAATTAVIFAGIVAAMIIALMVICTFG